MGKSIQIVVAKEDHTFELDIEALSSIVCQEHVKEKEIVVMSDAGDYRKGKSLLLNFILRYLVNDGSPDWLGPEDAPLKGFSWRGGCERDNLGILVWSEILMVPSGEKIPVLLLDTQGTFNSQSTVKDSATIFALSTMISSLQVYNLSQNIQEDDLQHLQLFTEYGRLALDISSGVPFLKLQFLVRDQSYPYEVPYGPDGGKLILDRRLQISKNQHPELQTLRKHISSSFSDIGCFLLPHPGLKVATNPNFDGRLSDFESDFKEQLKSLMSPLLSPENLVFKECGGNRIHGGDLLQYFKTILATLNGDTLPNPKSMLEATTEANNLSAVAGAKELYSSRMESLCGGNKPFLSSHFLDGEHLRIKDKALEQFTLRPKMGGEAFSGKYKEQLEQDIENQFLHYRTRNESKKSLTALITPATLFLVAMFFYFLSGCMSLIGLYPLVDLANLAMGAALIALCTWIYIRFSGNLGDRATVIDFVALWEYALGRHI